MESRESRILFWLVVGVAITLSAYLVIVEADNYPPGSQLEEAAEQQGL